MTTLTAEPTRTDLLRRRLDEIDVRLAAVDGRFAELEPAEHAARLEAFASDLDADGREATADVTQALQALRDERDALTKDRAAVAQLLSESGQEERRRLFADARDEVAVRQERQFGNWEVALAAFRDLALAWGRVRAEEEAIAAVRGRVPEAVVLECGDRVDLEGPVEPFPSHFGGFLGLLYAACLSESQNPLDSRDVLRPLMREQGVDLRHLAREAPVWLPPMRPWSRGI